MRRWLRLWLPGPLIQGLWLLRPLPVLLLMPTSTDWLLLLLLLLLLLNVRQLLVWPRGAEGCSR